MSRKMLDTLRITTSRLFKTMIQIRKDKVPFWDTECTSGDANAAILLNPSASILSQCLLYTFHATL